jgi:RNA polymerase sigma-70 factor (ECF subfamily)
MEESEEALMAAYAAGSPQAFQRLFERLAPRVHGFFQRSFRDREVADDLTQQTFLKLHRNRGRYDASRPLRPYLFTIAASVRRDELRRRYRLPPQAGEEALERVESSDSPISGRLDPAIKNALHAALDALPETQRVVIQLHRFEGLTFAEIAEVLGTTAGAVRVRAFRAYERLRTVLQPLLEESES